LVEQILPIFFYNMCFCRDCFLALSNHKFRAILGKSRVFGNELKPVVVAFSGSASSLALLKLLSDAVVTGSQHRRIMADPKVVFIDGMKNEFA
jgi:hypothetical protein